MKSPVAVISAVVISLSHGGLSGADENLISRGDGPLTATGAAESRVMGWGVAPMPT